MVTGESDWTTRARLAAVVGSALVLVACGESSDADDGGMGEEELVIDTGETVPFEAGDPMETEPMEWQYVHFPGAYCRDGNETGLGVNVNPDSDKLVIYLEGGGACFNPLTCVGNPRSWNESNLGTPGGILSRTGDSPFKDWNLVYIPYCSGDVFTGGNADGTGLMGDTMQGYINMGEYLERIVPTFEGKVSEVVLTGISAGGFGASYNWLRTQDAFGDIPVHLLDDSGPPLSQDYMPACWQKRIGEAWGWAETIYPACAKCDVEGGDVVVPMVEHALHRMAGSEQRFALLTNDEDGIIKTFLAYGHEDCKDFDALLPPGYPVGLYPEGLQELKERTAGDDNFAMFQITGGGHVLMQGNLDAEEAEGLTLRQFIEAFRDGSDDFRTVVQ